MRFLVDLYRWIVLLLVGASLILGFFILFLVIASPAPPYLDGMVLMIIIACALWFILLFGVTATFISIHDRIAEISHHAARAADSLERLADRAGGPS